MAEYLCKKRQEFSDNKKCVWILRVPIVSVRDLYVSAVNELEKEGFFKKL